jgi:hypothetical protein
MSLTDLDSQTNAKQMSLFRQILRLQEAVNGVFVQRIMANDLRRLLNAPADDDPVADALGDVSRIFQRCTRELGPVDGEAVRSSLESIVAESADDRSKGENGEGCVLLVWKMDHRGGGRFDKAKLVGIATLFRFKGCDNFTTLPRSFRSSAHHNVLVPYLKGWNKHTINADRTFPTGFKPKYMYIDVMCSTQPGVGRLLVLHAYRYALMKKTKGLLALSFTKHSTVPPASYKLFQDLGFTTIVRNTNYDVAGMYGHWVAKSTHMITFSGVIEELSELCTRSGYTERTRDSLVWRCPL